MPSPTLKFPNSGSPPLNPNAPDPREPQPPPQKGGLGLGGILGSIFGGGQQKPMQAPTAQPEGGPPTGLGDLPQLQRALLGFGDIAAGYRGQVGPSQRLMQQRKQEYDQKRQVYLQNLALLGQFEEALEKTPIDQLEAKKAKLRESYAKIPGVEPGMFDTFLGDTAVSKAMLEMASKSEAGKLIIARGGSMKDLNDFFRSPAGMQETIQIQDDAALPVVQKKVSALLNSSDPEVRAELEKIAKDGSTTAAEIRLLSERFGTDGPEGTKLTQAEIASLERQQGKVAQLIPGFTTDAEFEAKTKSERERAAKREDQTFIREENAANRAAEREARQSDRVEAKQVEIDERKRSQAREVEEFAQNGLDAIERLEAQIKDLGTFDLIGPGDQNFERYRVSLANAMARLQDPGSVNRPSEVEAALRGLPQPGLGQTNATALELLKAARDELEQRRRRAYRIRGLPDPISENPPKDVSSEAAGIGGKPPVTPQEAAAELARRRAPKGASSGK